MNKIVCTIHCLIKRQFYAVFFLLSFLASWKKHLVIFLAYVVFVWVFKGGSFQEALSMGLLAIGNLRAQLSYDLILSFS